MLVRGRALGGRVASRAGRCPVPHMESCPRALHSKLSTIHPPAPPCRSGAAPCLDFRKGLLAAHGLSLLLTAQPAGGGSPRTLLFDAGPDALVPTWGGVVCVCGGGGGGVFY